MHLLADLEIGWLNGWIYSAVLLAVSSSAYIFAKRMTSFAWMTRRQFLFAGLADVAMVGLSIFTLWTPIVTPGMLFWVGNGMYGVGLVTVILAIAAFARTPDDQPVTRGIYRAVRHPYYLGAYLSFLGIGLICREWLIILGTVASIIPGVYSAKWEEEHLRETYGDGTVE